MSVRTITKHTLLAGTRRFGVHAFLRTAFKRRLLVLCYHGVLAEDHPEAPLRTRNAVSLRTFSQQLSILGRYLHPVSARDVLDHVEGRTRLPDHACLITFDDGYRNNLTCAAGELQRQGMPALVHIATGLIGTDRLLWTQELDELFLGWPFQTIPMPGRNPDCEIPSSRTERIVLVNRARRLCKTMSDVARESYLDRLRNDPVPLEEDWYRELYEFLSWDDVRKLHSMGLAIGSHTVDHRILTRLEPSQLSYELTESKSTIERELGEECPWIAYPNGGPEDYSKEVLLAAEKAGYKVGFTLLDELNSPSLQPLEIRRMCIGTALSEDAFHATISGLLGFRNTWIR